MSLPNYPIVNAGLKYCNGLNISYAGAKLVDLAAGACRDSLNINDIILDADAQINGAIVGPNGCDQAALVASKFYAVYVIASSSSVDTSNSALGAGYDSAFQPVNVAPAPANPFPACGLLSLASNAAPYLPEGYDMYRRVGWVKTDGSANILKFYQYGTGETRSIWYDEPYQIGNFVAGSPVAYAPVNLSPAIPLSASEAKINVLYTCSNAAQFLQFIPGSSSNTANNQIIFGCGSAAAQYDTLEVAANLYPATLPTLPYVAVQVKVAAGDNVSIWVVSYEDYLD